MCDGENAFLRLQFNPKVRLEFHGSNIASDAGLLAFREFDDALDLADIARVGGSRTRTTHLQPQTPHQLLRRDRGSA